MMKIGIPFSAAIVHSFFDDIVFLNKSGMNPLEERWSLTGARGHAVGGESCPRTGSTMGDFGREKGEKKPLGLSKSGYVPSLPRSSSGNALSNLVIFRLVHSTVTFTETLKLSTS